MSPKEEEEIRERFEDLNDGRLVLVGYEQQLIKDVGTLLAEIDALRDCGGGE